MSLDAGTLKKILADPASTDQEREAAQRKLDAMRASQPPAELPEHERSWWEPRDPAEILRSLESDPITDADRLLADVLGITVAELRQRAIDALREQQRPKPKPPRLQTLSTPSGEPAVSRSDRPQREPERAPEAQKAAPTASAAPAAPKPAPPVPAEPAPMMRLRHGLPDGLMLEELNEYFYRALRDPDPQRRVSGEVLLNRYWERVHGDRRVPPYALYLLELLRWVRRNPGAEFKLPNDRSGEMPDPFGGVDVLCALEHDFVRRRQFDEVRKRERQADDSAGCNGIF